jgi:hypothetical protein
MEAATVVVDMRSTIHTPTNLLEADAQRQTFPKRLLQQIVEKAIGSEHSWTLVDGIWWVSRRGALRGGGGCRAPASTLSSAPLFALFGSFSLPKPASSK